MPVIRQIARKERQWQEPVIRRRRALLQQQSENISDQMGLRANSKLLWTGESFEAVCPMIRSTKNATE